MACTSQSPPLDVVLVTGGSGLVGHAIQHVIANEGEGRFGSSPNEKWIFLSSKDGDLRCMDDARKIFQKYTPTKVVHLAASVGGLFANMNFKADMFRDNILINDNVIKCAHDFKVSKVLSCLSTCIFPDKTSYPIDEDMIHNGPPHTSNLGYAYAKRMLDVQNKVFYDQYGDKFTSVIPTNIFGPYDNYDLESSHVIPGLIHKCYLASLDQGNDSEKVLRVAGTGRPLRQFIYSRDLAKLIVWALREYEEIDPIILSVPEKDEMSIHDVANSIMHAFAGFNGQLAFDTSKEDGQFKKTASNVKMQKYLPDFAFTPFDTAIRDSVDWFINNKHKCRTGESRS